MEEIKKKHIAILGSTGSIGTQALEVIQANPNRFQVELRFTDSASHCLQTQCCGYW